MATEYLYPSLINPQRRTASLAYQCIQPAIKKIIFSMKFKFVVNHEDNTLRCIYNDRVVGMLKNVGEIVSIKRVSDIEPHPFNPERGWVIQYKLPTFHVECSGYLTRQDALNDEHDFVERKILQTRECKEFLGKAD